VGAGHYPDGESGEYASAGYGGQSGEPIVDGTDAKRLKHAGTSLMRVNNCSGGQASLQCLEKRL